MVDAFLRAARSGDFEALVQVLDPTVVLRPDAAAVAMGSYSTTTGAEHVASALAGGAQTARRAVVNGLAGLVWAPRGDVRGVIQFTVVDGRITAIDVTADVERIDSYDIAVARHLTPVGSALATPSPPSQSGAITISTPDQEPGHQAFETGQPAAS